MNSTWFVWSSIFSLIGLAVFTYGRRQRRGAPTFVGIALMIYPYFVSGAFALVSIGVLLIVGLVMANRFEDSL